MSDFTVKLNFCCLNETLKRLSHAVAVPELPETAIPLILSDMEHQYNLNVAKKNSWGQITRTIRELYGLPPVNFCELESVSDIMRRARDFVVRHYIPLNMHVVLVINNEASFDSAISYIQTKFNDAFDQSGNVPYQVANRRTGPGVYPWFYALELKYQTYGKSLQVLQSMRRIFLGETPKTFEEACGWDPGLMKEEAVPGWGSGRRLGDSLGDYNETTPTEVSDEVGTLAPSFLKSKDQLLAASFRVDDEISHSCASLIWQSLLGRVAPDALRSKAEGLVTGVRCGVYDWGLGGHYLTVSMAMTPLGFSRSELILTRLLPLCFQDSGK